MANKTVITNDGKDLILNRTFKGSPDYKEPSLISVGTGTTEPSESDSSMESPVTIDTDNFKGFSSGYPTLDESGDQATIRAFLLSTEANGNTITEFGILNNDSTKKLFSHSTHTSIDKDNAVEISYVAKYEIE